MEKLERSVEYTRDMLIRQGMFATSLLLSCRMDLRLRIDIAASIGGQGK